jgi:hypothetical protein
VKGSETDTHPSNDIMLGRCRIIAMDANADDINVADITSLHSTLLVSFPAFFTLVMDGT